MNGETVDGTIDMSAILFDTAFGSSEFSYTGGDLSAILTGGEWIRIDGQSEVFSVVSADASKVIATKTWMGPNQFGVAADVVESSSCGFVYEVTFVSEVGDLDSIEADGSLLTGSGAAVTVSACEEHRLQAVSTSATSALSGTFRLHFGIEMTADIDFDADSSTVKAALEALEGIYMSSVSVSAAGVNGERVWTIRLDSVEDELLPLFAEGHLLTGDNAAITVAHDCPQGTTSGRSGQDFVARLSGPSSVMGDVTYQGTGLYEVSYMTPREGDYLLSISLATPFGLSAEYYNNRWLFDSPAVTRVDSSINFYWDTFLTPTGKDYISARWTGYIRPSFTEKYTFVVEVNDGARLWIDGTLIVDEFEAESNDGTFNTFQGNASLVSDRLHDIILEFRENTGEAVARLKWYSASQPLSVVPSSALYHTDIPIAGSPFSVSPKAVEPTEPTNVVLAIHDETSLDITWNAPENDGGAAITSYRVEWWNTWGTLAEQSILLTGVSGGTFTLEHGGVVTADLSYDILDDHMELVLESLPSIGDVDVTFTDLGGAKLWTVTFLDAPTDPSALLVHDAGLNSGTAEICFGGVAAGGCLSSYSTPGTSATEFCNDAACPDVDVAADLDVSDGATFSYKITGLTQGTTYNAVVKAYNGNSHNLQSYGLRSAVVSEAPRQPPAAPEVVENYLVAGSSTAIKVYWDAPATSDGGDRGATIDQYKIEWSLDAAFTNPTTYVGTEAGFQSSLVTGRYEYTISGLSMGAQVYIRVYAHNEMGYGAAKAAVSTPIIPRKSPETIAYGSVGLSTVVADDVVTVADSIESLRVSWQAPSSNHGDDISAYKVEWWSGSDGTHNVQTITTSSTGATTGSFTISYEGETTDNLDWDVSATDMRTALEGLCGIQSVSIVKGALVNFGYPGPFIRRSMGHEIDVYRRHNKYVACYFSKCRSRRCWQ